MPPRPYSRYTRASVGGFDPTDAAAQMIDGEVIQIRERVRALGDDFQSLASNVSVKFTEVNASLQGLATKIEERGRAPWNLMIGFASFLTVFAGAVGGLAYWPIREQLSELKSVELKLADDKISTREFMSYLDLDKQRRDQSASLYNARLDRMQQDIRDQMAVTVPRAEHLEQWAAQREKDGDQQRQIDELRRSMEGIYSPKDALSRMERRLDYLEDIYAKRGVSKELP